MIAPALQFAFTIRIDFPPGPRLRYPLAGGDSRGFVPIVGGVVTGPRVQGEVVAGSGGDWPVFHADGVVAFDARYLLRASDGTLIHIANRGYAHAPPEVQAAIARGETVDPSLNYFRLAPVFETSPGPHEWLNRTLVIGMGEKHAAHSVFHYFEVR